MNLFVSVLAHSTNLRSYKDPYNTNALSKYLKGGGYGHEDERGETSAQK